MSLQVKEFKFRRNQALLCLYAYSPCIFYSEKFIFVFLVPKNPGVQFFDGA